MAVGSSQTTRCEKLSNNPKIKVARSERHTNKDLAVADYKKDFIALLYEYVQCNNVGLLAFG